MKNEKTILTSGNLATARRTISGLLGQFALFQCSEKETLRIIKEAGLPATSFDDPDFPVSLQQDLTVCNALVMSLPPSQSPATMIFSLRKRLGLGVAGVLGMVMRTASSHEEVNRLFFKYPQLSWGHSRLLISADQEHLKYEFTIDRPTLRTTTDHDTDRLVQYCLTLDLIVTTQLIVELTAATLEPIEVGLPYPCPLDWDNRTSPYPVKFNTDVAYLIYPRSISDLTLPGANPVQFKNYSRIAEKLSQTLADEITTAERVNRWLWAHTPPLNRSEVASLLAISERNLTRKLSAEKTTFSEILGQVQEQRGKNLLRNSALTIAEVGYRLGYTDPAAFTRAFSRRNGVTPQKWRNAQD